MTKILVTRSFGFVKYFAEQYGDNTLTNSIAFYDYLKRVVCFSTRNIGAPEIPFWQTAHSSFALKKPCYIISLSDEIEKIEQAQPASCFHIEVGQSSYLWLNGSFSIETIKMLASKTGIQSDSSAEHLLHYMINTGNLSVVKEPFGCVMIHMNNLYAFSNDSSKLYTDEQMSISSDTFDDCHPLPTNKIFRFDFISENTQIESCF